MLKANKDRFHVICIFKTRSYRPIFNVKLLPYVRQNWGRRKNEIHAWIMMVIFACSTRSWMYAIFCFKTYCARPSEDYVYGIWQYSVFYIGKLLFVRDNLLENYSVIYLKKIKGWKSFLRIAFHVMWMESNVHAFIKVLLCGPAMTCTVYIPWEYVCHKDHWNGAISFAKLALIIAI